MQALASQPYQQQPQQTFAAPQPQPQQAPPQQQQTPASETSQVNDDEVDPYLAGFQAGAAAAAAARAARNNPVASQQQSLQQQQQQQQQQTQQIQPPPLPPHIQQQQQQQHQQQPLPGPPTSDLVNYHMAAAALAAAGAPYSLPPQHLPLLQNPLQQPWPFNAIMPAPLQPPFVTAGGFPTSSFAHLPADAAAAAAYSLAASASMSATMSAPAAPLADPFAAYTTFAATSLMPAAAAAAAGTAVPGGFSFLDSLTLDADFNLLTDHILDPQPIMTANVAGTLAAAPAAVSTKPPKKKAKRKNEAGEGGTKGKKGKKAENNAADGGAAARGKSRSKSLSQPAEGEKSPPPTTTTQASPLTVNDGTSTAPPIHLATSLPPGAISDAAQIKLSPSTIPSLAASVPTFESLALATSAATAAGSTSVSAAPASKLGTFVLPPNIAFPLSTTPVTTATTGPTVKHQRKVAHNAIERRYRTNINDRITELRLVVPALNGPKIRDAKGSKRNRSAANDDSSSSDEDGEMPLIDGVPAAKKLNKATILKKSTEYILHLKGTNTMVVDENARLRAIIASMGGGEMLKQLDAMQQAQQVQQQQQFAAAAAAHAAAAERVPNSSESSGSGSPAPPEPATPPHHHRSGGPGEDFATPTGLAVDVGNDATTTGQGLRLMVLCTMCVGILWAPSPFTDVHDHVHAVGKVFGADATPTRHAAVAAAYVPLLVVFAKLAFLLICGLKALQWAARPSRRSNVSGAMARAAVQAVDDCGGGGAAARTVPYEERWRQLCVLEGRSLSSARGVGWWAVCGQAVRYAIAGLWWPLSSSSSCDGFEASVVKLSLGLLEADLRGGMKNGEIPVSLIVCHPFPLVLIYGSLFLFCAADNKYSTPSHKLFLALHTLTTIRRFPQSSTDTLARFHLCAALQLRLVSYKLSPTNNTTITSIFNRILRAVLDSNVATCLANAASASHTRQTLNAIVNKHYHEWARSANRLASVDRLLDCAVVRGLVLTRGGVRALASGVVDMDVKDAEYGDDVGGEGPGDAISRSSSSSAEAAMTIRAILREPAAARVAPGVLVLALVAAGERGYAAAVLARGVLAANDCNDNKINDNNQHLVMSAIRGTIALALLVDAALLADDASSGTTTAAAARLVGGLSAALAAAKPTAAVKRDPVGAVVELFALSRARGAMEKMEQNGCGVTAGDLDELEVEKCRARCGARMKCLLKEVVRELAEDEEDVGRALVEVCR
ncbi:hypothetical protein HDU86_007545 [Geranomyces michiganensis]|nr:hypothetical protein HDU86_007545 [Geranomyces michiganensis]